MKMNEIKIEQGNGQVSGPCFLGLRDGLSKAADRP